MARFREALPGADGHTITECQQVQDFSMPTNR